MGINMEKKTIRIHRLGSVTFGVVLLALGTVCTIHVLVPQLNLWLAFRLWPLVLIILGVEVLAGSKYRCYDVVRENGQVVEQCKVIYDVPAILMTACTLIFTVGLAWVQWLYDIYGYRGYLWL